MDGFFYDQKSDQRGDGNTGPFLQLFCRWCDYLYGQSLFFSVVGYHWIRPCREVYYLRYDRIRPLDDYALVM